MDFKKVLIGVAVIGVVYYFYNKSKKGSSSTTGGETSSANGAQLLAVAKANGGYSNAQACDAAHPPCAKAGGRCMSVWECDQFKVATRK
jgi:hypothetical protein